MSNKSLGPLSLEKLREVGAFVSDVPVPMPVEWAGGLYDIYVRRLSGCHMIDLLAGAGGEERSATARILSASICFDPEGKEKLSFVDAYKLVEPLASEFMDAVNKVNGGAVRAHEASAVKSDGGES